MTGGQQTATGEFPVDSLAHSLNLLRDTYHYNHWVYSLLRPHIGDSVLEVGAGIGNLTQFILACPRVVCIEPEAEYADPLRAFLRPHANVTIVQALVADAVAGAALQAEPFDSAICVNVLEHIEDDQAAVRQMVSVLRPGGRLALFIPACPFAYGGIDAALGHCRRYTRRRLRQLAAGAGCRVHTLHAFNLIGLLGWWWEGRVMKKTHIDPAKARAIDALVPYLSAAERLVRPPLGQSLFAVFERGA